MKRKSDHCTEYKNGNITIKYDPDAIKEARRDSVITILSILDEIDCYFIGETYCLNNFETGHTVYNLYSDLVYIFPWTALDKLHAGKTVRLYAQTPDEYDREIINNEFMEE